MPFDRLLLEAADGLKAVGDATMGQDFLEAAHGPNEVHRRVAAGGAGAVRLHHLGDGVPRGLGAPGKEAQLDVVDPQYVPVAEDDFFHPLAVDESPVRAAEVFDVITTASDQNHGMLARHAAGMDLARVAVLRDGESPSSSVTEQYDPRLGFHVLKVRAFEQTTPSPEGAPLYFPLTDLNAADVREVTLIPFYFRANRKPDTRWVTFVTYR